MNGWHWIQEDHTLRTGEPVTAGQTYRAEGPLVLCQNGVHASRRALDALQYAPGPVICRVNLGGEIQHDTGKSVARERRVLWLADATLLLHEFACGVATNALLQVEASGETIDPRSWAAIQTKEAWLRGEASDNDLAAAKDAAWAAARGATWAAAWAAARGATWAAARAATWDAARAATARDAARGVAWAAARGATWAAARDAQNVMLETMLMRLAPNKK